MHTTIEATIDDLYRVPENGKAELVDGELVLMSPTGFWPGRASGRIYRSLDDYEQRTGGGFAIPDNVGFIVNLPQRKSFSPSAAFYIGQSTGMKFLEGAPVFAAEVRSEGDYGEHAERAMARKRADYFCRRAHWWCRMSICSPTMRCVSTAPALQIKLSSTAEVTRLKPSPLCRVGRWLWTSSLVE